MLNILQVIQPPMGLQPRVVLQSFQPQGWCRGGLHNGCRPEGRISGGTTKTKATLSFTQGLIPQGRLSGTVNVQTRNKKSSIHHYLKG